MIEGERKLVTVRRIGNIEAIPNADMIVKATIDGWELVTQKGNYNISDLCVYFEIDSFIPVSENFEFLRKSSFKSTKELGDGFRIRTIKMRGQISQGLSLPMKEFFQQDQKGNWLYPNDDGSTHVLQEGDDLTGFFGVKKYEKPAVGNGGGTAKGNFPSFIPKTDQERIQNCFGSIKGWINFSGKTTREITETIDLEYLNDFDTNTVVSPKQTFWKEGDRWFTSDPVENSDAVKAERDLFEATLKLDGSSMTVYHKDGTYGVCSRNLEVRRDQANHFWKTALEGRLIEAMVTLGANIAVQGEIMGPGIQGNREKLGEHQFFVFDIYDIDGGKYLSPLDRRHMLGRLYDAGMSDLIEPVPDLGNISFSNFSSAGDFLKIAERDSLAVGVTAEGVVFKSLVDGSKSFKAISNLFLLNEKD
jgi:RNA ligase (TIGR02306 family)